MLLSVSAVSPRQKGGTSRVPRSPPYGEESAFRCDALIVWNGRLVCAYLSPPWRIPSQLPRHSG